MHKKEEILGKIKETILRVDPQSEVFLFGSRAREEAREESDWDILVLVPGAVDLQEEQKFRHELFELEVEYGLAISTFVYSKGEWESKYQVTPLYHNIMQEGIKI